MYNFNVNPECAKSFFEQIHGTRNILYLELGVDFIQDSAECETDFHFPTPKEFNLIQ